MNDNRNDEEKMSDDSPYSYYDHQEFFQSWQLVKNDETDTTPEALEKMKSLKRSLRISEGILKGMRIKNVDLVTEEIDQFIENLNLNPEPFPDFNSDSEDEEETQKEVERIERVFNLAKKINDNKD